MRRAEPRAGFTLLEALLALTLLSAAGIGWAVLAGQASFALRAAQREERIVGEAARLLRRLEALPAEQLEAMAGRRRVGGLTLRVTVEHQGLIGVDVGDAERGTELLATYLYRPEAPRATR